LSAQPESLQRISPEYRKEQERLHETTDYGTAAEAYAPLVSSIINRMGVTHLLDYGCGANTTLAKTLTVDHKLTYQAYDPGVPRFSKDPVPAQMVACIEVLEHIEPEYLDSVLDDLARLAEGIAFLSFCTAPAMKTLSDGRNAHLIVEPLQWWLPKLWNRWDIQTVQQCSDNSYFVVGLAKHRIEDQSGVQIV
jgi:hypothetical protein